MSWWSGQQAPLLYDHALSLEAGQYLGVTGLYRS
jgi:hypothetical protein